MPIQATVFAQLMALLDHDELNRCIERYEGNARVKSFTCLDQFLCLVFAQFAEKRSLSATVFTLSRMRQKLYHMGIRGNIAKSTLADANQNRDWRIWRDYANSLIARCRILYDEESIQVDEDIQAAVYAFDSSTVTCVCRYLSGRISARQKRESSSTPSWTCVETFRCGSILTRHWAATSKRSTTCQ